MKRGISLFLICCMLFGSVLSFNSMAYVTEDYYTRTDEAHLPFEDVKESHWFYDAVEFCYVNSIVSGMNEYTFGHGTALTRAQFVTMLANAEGIDTSAYDVEIFDDVASDKWFYGAVAWAYNEGIVSGMSETEFQPNGILTRSQLAVVMNNYMNEKYTVEINENALDGFSDKPKSEYWYHDAMVYAVSAGLISGNSNGTLTAVGNVTRAQAAVIFKSFMEKYFYGECEHSFTEATCIERPTCTECGMCIGLAQGHKVIKGLYNCVSYDWCQICHTKVECSKYVHLFGKANCNMPRTCAYCGITRGTTVGEHQWWPATCTNPKMCKVCYKTEGNSLGGHDFTQATCTKASYCTKCGTKGTDVLGHSYRDGKCTRCGLVNPYDRVVYAVKNKGKYNSGTGIITYRVSSSPSVSITYDTVTKELCASIRVDHGNGAYSDTVLTLPKTDHTARYDYRYYYKNAHNDYDWCVQKFDAHLFNSSYKPDDLGSGWYYAPYFDMHKSNIVSNVDKLLRAIDPALSNLCGSDASEFGFLYY
ncbi:MAG: S-layer homology domain-containing protein [Clostridia bacterium]|nr:S-layer homology domain-containing protein [Clostridia bacterium]